MAAAFFSAEALISVNRPDFFHSHRTGKERVPVFLRKGKGGGCAEGHIRGRASINRKGHPFCLSEERTKESRYLERSLASPGGLKRRRGKLICPANRSKCFNKEQDKR